MAIVKLISIDFFFGIIPCKYSTTLKGYYKWTRILWKGGINFYRKQWDLKNSSGQIQLAQKVSLTFRTHKMGVKNATVTQWRTCKHLCPVRIWTNIIPILKSYPGTSDKSPIDTLWVENFRTSTTSQMIIKILRSGTLYFEKEHLRFSQKEMGNQSLR